jgi:hypothetical protein
MLSMGFETKNLVMKKCKVIVYFLPVVLILTIPILQFVVNTKYTFSEPHPFKGEYLYNPYKGMDSRKWEMANFHAHTRIFFGLTDGAANSDQSLDSLYKYFNYNVIGISNYQSINKFESKNNWFVPVYEHGYQYYKNHQLVINAKKVRWLDYFFRQTLNNKQSIIDHLKKDTSVILTIVHPGPRQAYPLNDFKYLSNYDCLEIASNKYVLTAYYDTILSTGHPVFLMANDDAHDLRKINDGCHSFNIINTDLIKDSILHSIKTGRLVGVNFNVSPYETNEEKKSGLQKLPEITSVILKDDTLIVSLNKLVKTIKFIGQKGAERKKITNAAIGSYFFNKQDTYIRTEIECHDGTMYFLNPVFRYNGVQLPDHVSSPNLFKTWLWRSVVLFVLLLIFVIMRIIKKT